MSATMRDHSCKLEFTPLASPSVPRSDPRLGGVMPTLRAQCRATEAAVVSFPPMIENKPCAPSAA